MLIILRDYFLFFAIYSFGGWVVEILNFMIFKKKFVNRGFLIGPYLPIYGFGSIFIITFLQKYQYELITLFCMSMFICAVLEYFASFVMEKLFRARWWDYSDKRFNINGRICLETLCLFGIGGCFEVYFLHPIITSVLGLFSNYILSALAIVLFVIMLIDFLVSFKIIFNFRSFASNLKKDSSVEINKIVKKIISSKSVLGKRLINAFPNLQTNLKKVSTRRIKFHKKRK